ncbi:hypothetical protein HGRIS_008346 [Hohenbuehelia grisea]|uniref:non-specific serine/threonine protein kinase n=1 Tax=Hohenbuehelia grisea TaxID=104357 RepID=A0ABR3J7V0_9AGAR
MAQPHANQIYSQNPNPGTLVPGQNIAVGQFNVQVERYLSQGGFAHVYLVRTATPVYNTTHHVLKRIAVANEGMLTEVKKEVDIMRLLKGHPNIVHLIDAAWHKMSNGMFEVFILMEYCPGGGIIDMMNRRLRERLTEAEILQIFVDVCEGVACMHNSRPPLLHRDLKVENILQSSPTSYKLCDFGSASVVSPRPPSTTQEIRALEADLNRHTTLQYRAPEMVDPYLRRPIDEKSDVWALGVLLYKLCYYTTPFEEHGPLAILNVQYKTPPYPAYSAQMNALIASMLREHGVQRPSAFEILAHVHQLRGTKSKFQYTIPAPQPLSPRHSSFKASSHAPPPSLPHRTAPAQQAVSPNTAALDGVPRNAGVQAREMVLEAIAPMRRGRPTGGKGSRDLTSSTSRQSSPHKKDHSSPSKSVQPLDQNKNWIDAGFDAEGEKAWKAMAATKVSSAKPTTQDDPWSLQQARQEKAKSPGFGDDFGQKLWDSFDPKSAKASLDLPSASTSTSRSPGPTPRIPAFTGSDIVRAKAITGGKERDAFDGLGLGMSNSKPAPTLAEARKLRTGLAVMGTPANVPGSRDSPRISRPTSASRTNSYMSSQSPDALSPPPTMIRASASGSSAGLSASLSRPSSSKPNYSPQPGDLSAETRFPSLEELDATFNTPSTNNGRAPSVIGVKAGSQLLSHLQSQSHPAKPSVGSDPALVNDSLRPGQRSYGDGVRSEQVTGTAMRQTTPNRWSSKPREGGGDYLDYPSSKATPDSSVTPKRADSSALGSKSTIVSYTSAATGPKRPSPSPTKADEARKPVQKLVDAKDVDTLSSTQYSALAAASKRSNKDWLTGSDTESISSTTNAPAYAVQLPGLRDMPGKRSSHIQRSNNMSVSESTTPRNPSPASQATPVKAPVSTSPTKHIRQTTSTFKSNDGPMHARNQLPPARRNDTHPAAEPAHDSASSADEGPEDANGFTSRPSRLPDQPKPRHKARQSSVHDLVDLWGGGVSGGAVSNDKEKDTRPAQSKRSSVNLSALSVPMPRSVSPQPSSSSASESQLSRKPSLPTSRTRKQSTPSLANVSPVTGRSRPQSMFIFPAARPSESPGLASPTVSASLSPPDDARPRPTRRTSISDMVQLYEAIGGARRTSGPGPGPPQVAEKPAELRTKRLSDAKKPDLNSDAARFAAGRGLASLQLPRSAGTTSADTRRSPTYLSRASPTGLPAEAVKEVDRPKVVRRPSPSPEPKSATSETQERPYQGVGKLIDQWQRKAETDAPKQPAVNRRGGFGAKRPGISNTGRG